MAFNRFKNKNTTSKKPQQEKAETTEPFVVSVNPYISVRRALDLIARINSAQVSSRLKENGTEIKKILTQYDFPNFLKENRTHLFNPDLGYHLRREIFNLLVSLDNEFFCNKPRVKAVVAGLFNAGKSSFLNYIVGHNILPDGNGPSTSVPTFIFCQNSISTIRVYGENKSGAILSLDKEILDHIKHSTDSTTAHQIATSINRFIVEIPHSEYQNLIFIDTPGFGNRDNKNTNASNDDRIAKSQLRSADFMVYLVPSDGGAVKDEDWMYIDSFGERPVVLVLTKNDLVTKKNNQNIFDETVVSAKKHPNVKYIVSLSAEPKDESLFLSSSGTSINDIFINISKGISTNTEIKRCWKRVEELFYAEIKASKNILIHLKKKFEELKSIQNDVHKDNLERTLILKTHLTNIRKTLIEDINKSERTVKALQDNHQDFYKRMNSIYGDYAEYYNRRYTSSSSLLKIINDMHGALSYRSLTIQLTNLRYSGFYSEDERKKIVEYIESLSDSYQNEMERRYNELEIGCNRLQERIKKEDIKIDHFSSILKDLQSWLNVKVSELEHIHVSDDPQMEKVNIFDAIMDMDEEKIILALSTPTDLTTMYNADGYSPLTFSAACGNLPAIRLMLSLKSKGRSIPNSIRDLRGRTMMEAARERGQETVLIFLTNYYKIK